MVDGWTKDQRETKLNVRAQIPLPEVGKKINIFVSYVVDVDHFYGQIVPKNCKTATDLTAERIFEHINTPEMIGRLKKIFLSPGECELVIAMFEGDWYRARVLRKMSEIQYRVSIRMEIHFSLRPLLAYKLV